jgi:hypothetical protein
MKNTNKISLLILILVLLSACSDDCPKPAKEIIPVYKQGQVLASPIPMWTYQQCADYFKGNKIVQIYSALQVGDTDVYIYVLTNNSQICVNKETHELIF